MFYVLSANVSKTKGKPVKFRCFMRRPLFDRRLSVDDCAETSTRKQFPLRVKWAWSLSASGLVNNTEIELVVKTPLHLRLLIQNSFRFGGNIGLEKEATEVIQTR